jgi:hypothetical protein
MRSEHALFFLRKPSLQLRTHAVIPPLDIALKVVVGFILVASSMQVEAAPSPNTRSPRLGDIQGRPSLDRFERTCRQGRRCSRL